MAGESDFSFEQSASGSLRHGLLQLMDRSDSVRLLHRTAAEYGRPGTVFRWTLLTARVDYGWRV